MRTVILAAFALTTTLGGAACSSSGVTGAADGGAGNDGGAPSSAAAPALSCGQILDCIGTCADADTACPDACAAKGSPDAQDEVLALATCIDKGACKDADCVGTMCQPELGACLQPTGSGGTPIEAGAAPVSGSVAPELVGNWVSSSMSYEFGADGIVSRYQDVNTGGCHSKLLEKGTATGASGQLSIYFTSGVVELCGKPGTDPYQPKKEDFTYEIRAGAGVRGEDELRLVHLQCSYTDASSMALYCSDAVYRQ